MLERINDIIPWLDPKSTRKLDQRQKTNVNLLASHVTAICTSKAKKKLLEEDDKIFKEETPIVNLNSTVTYKNVQARTVSSYIKDIEGVEELDQELNVRVESWHNKVNREVTAIFRKERDNQRNGSIKDNQSRFNLESSLVKAPKSREEVFSDIFGSSFLASGLQRKGSKVEKSSNYIIQAPITSNQKKAKGPMKLSTRFVAKKEKQETNILDEKHNKVNLTESTDIETRQQINSLNELSFASYSRAGMISFLENKESGFSCNENDFIDSDTEQNKVSQFISFKSSSI